MLPQPSILEECQLAQPTDSYRYHTHLSGFFAFEGVGVVGGVGRVVAG